MKPAAAMLLIAGLTTMTQAAETGTLTLACRGTTVEGYEGAEPNQISMGLIVNFTAGTVQGFGTPDLLGVPVKITGINDMTIAFSGTGQPFGDKWSISGSIHRVTGEVEAAEIETDGTGKTFPSTAYSLKCRPT